MLGYSSSSSATVPSGRPIRPDSSSGSSGSGSSSSGNPSGGNPSGGSPSGTGGATSRGAEPDTLEGAWKALANPVRRQILDLLVEGPRPTGWLAGRFPSLSRFAVMQHLRVLEAGGLVIRRKVGRQTMNHLNPVPIQQIYHRWVARFQEPWAEALVSLKHGLERDHAGGPGAPASGLERTDQQEKQTG